MNPQAAYDELIERSREVAVLGSCSALLGWDEQTYMPRGGVEHRGNQMALLAGLQHERATSPRLGELLDVLEHSELVRDRLSAPAVNVRELRRKYDRLVRLPRALVEELAKVATLAQQAWVDARQANQFARFQPWLDSMFALKRREAECLGYESSPYDPLLDEFEPGAKTHEIAALFAALRQDLLPLVAAIVSSNRRPDGSILRRAYPIDRQRLFGEQIAALVGFDFERGRLDTTAHPFCSKIGPGDCRITTRWSECNFNESFFGILHEVGHGLYDQGLDESQFGTPMGEEISLGVHESQSRLWENAVGRSASFWQHVFPLARQVFPQTLHDVSLEAFHFAVNAVEPSCNRVQADEVTYNLHILVRFELEQALLTGDLAPADLPGAWNEKYRLYLGVSPPSDTEGCLQDIHWSAGLVGYFPTYTLGNVFAAQLFEQASRDVGALDASFARGAFRGLLDWLRTHVHRHGQRYRANELIEVVTGAPPSHRPLARALVQKYGALYDL